MLFSNVFKKEPIQSVKELSYKLEYEAKLARKWVGYFYLSIPKSLGKCNGSLQNRVVGLDPEIKTFCTGCDPNGVITKLEKSDIFRIYKLCRSIDKFHWKWS